MGIRRQGIRIFETWDTRLHCIYAGGLFVWTLELCEHKDTLLFFCFRERNNTFEFLLYSPGFVMLRKAKYVLGGWRNE